MSIPANVTSILQTYEHQLHQSGVATQRANISSANNIVRHSAAKTLDEPSPTNARAVDKILRLPK